MSTEPSTATIPAPWFSSHRWVSRKSRVLRAKRSIFQMTTASKEPATSVSAFHPWRSRGACLVADTPSSWNSATTSQPRAWQKVRPLSSCRGIEIDVSLLADKRA